MTIFRFRGNGRLKMWRLLWKTWQILSFMILGYVLGWFITIEAEKIQVQTYWMRFYLWKWGPRRPFCFLLGPATRGVARSGLREKLKVYTHTYPYAKNQRVCIFCPVGPFDDTFLFTYSSLRLLRFHQRRCSSARRRDQGLNDNLPRYLILLNSPSFETS